MVKIYAKNIYDKKNCFDISGCSYLCTKINNHFFPPSNVFSDLKSKIKFYTGNLNTKISLISSLLYSIGI